MPKKKLKTTIKELSLISANMTNLMLSKELGVKTSLLLHRNVKAIKGYIDDYDAELKVIQSQCYVTNEENQVVYDEKTRQPEFLPNKVTEFKAAIDKLNEKEVEVELEVLDVSKLPADLGKINETNFFQFVPPLFDTVYVEEEEYKALGT